MSEYLKHTGTPQPYINQPIGSGRYRKGTGENPGQHDFSISARKGKLMKGGMSEVEAAHALGFKSTGELRTAITNENNRIKSERIAHAKYLMEEKGLGWTAIASEMGLSKSQESTIRSWFEKRAVARRNKKDNLYATLKEQALKKKYVDVGVGAAMRIGVSDTMLGAAVERLIEEEGFTKQKIHVAQLGTTHQTEVKVLCAPGVTLKELNANRDKIRLIDDYKENKDRSLANLEPPVSVDPKRVYVRYAEEGGKDKDGVIELRRGVPDISLNNADYAQVRIAVNGTHFLKGMAVYGDNKDIPRGYDIVFNTNKTKDVPMMGEGTNSVLKKLKDDPENPFKATIKPEEDLVLAQRHYVDPKTGERKTSPINIVNEEGDWSRWSKTLSSQFLSKQAVPLAKNQLNILYNDQKVEFEKIKKLTNPIVKENLLSALAEDCDSKAVHLKAAGLPRQASKIILPAPEIKPNEIVAPTYKDGEHVVLVRFPHGGKFEIPELIVNNKGNKKALNMLGKAIDAVAIHPSAATRLSGADFDGDTVLVIPVNKRIKVDTIDPNKHEELKPLKDFDTGLYERTKADVTKENFNSKRDSLYIRQGKSFEPVGNRRFNPSEEYYDASQTFKRMDEYTKGIQMGVVSNLITDMHLQKAPLDEMVRAVKHSMVVIDAEKHDLNWRQSEKDFRIGELHKKYQGKTQGGASTLISRAKKSYEIDARQEGGVDFYPSKMTPAEREAYYRGEKVYRPSNETKAKFNKKTGEWEYVQKREEHKWLSVVDDAYELTSGGSKKNPGTPMEAVYAEHSNKMKALANDVRKELRAIKQPHVSQSAKSMYKEETRSLDEKYARVMQNKPLERQANLIGNEQLKAWMKANAGQYDKDDVKKKRSQFQNGARYRVGKEAYRPKFTPKEWEAIQARAYTPSKARVLISAADTDHVRELAMPKQKTTITPAMKNQIKAYSRGDWTIKEIADHLHISTSTVSKILSGNYQ